jgi:pimeloyl-ACP methyl ester carboxylesterase
MQRERKMLAANFSEGRDPNTGLFFKTLGEGPLVLFCHGWPESWFSWRHQMQAVAAAGFKAVAADMRGYGESPAPESIEAYAMPCLVGDMLSLVRHTGADKAVIVGHDWGAPVAWQSALWRPDCFRAVVGMSVPWTPSGPIDFLSHLEKRGIRNFYMQYFQQPGLAETEFEKDIAASLRCIYFSGSGDAPERQATFGLIDMESGFLASCLDPLNLSSGVPEWLQEHLDYVVPRFNASGFRGGLNWYRNLHRNWLHGAPWRGRVIQQPSLFIAGERDGVLQFPASKAQIEAFDKTLPGHRGVHILPGAGHWIQQERPKEVSDLLIDFLRGLP